MLLQTVVVAVADAATRRRRWLGGRPGREGGVGEVVGGREGGRDTRVIVLLALPFGGTQVQTDASQGICPQPVPSCQSCQSSCSWTARAPRGLLSHAPHLHSFPVPRCDVTGAGDRRPVAMRCTHGPIYISISIYLYIYVHAVHVSMASLL